ncbi:MAG: twin-arginine translocase TatA/TatE family subunit [Nitratiruptor sp.]|nr:twin-arginine translocase TatA/TatE family subunit [Nitratiruptor sp.]NPA83054.1 twin-arginine translocase TatA/TatE family subunit [Campylobacterota bacterium]
MGMPSMPELLVILAIVVLLFGAKKIPELAKGIGAGIKNFKKAMRDDDEELGNKEERPQVAQGAPSQSTTAQPQGSQTHQTAQTSEQPKA